jgi:hypothetical protein
MNTSRPSVRSRGWIFAVALFVLALAEALRLYLVMPFPGSQVRETVAFAYALHRAIWPLRIVLGAIVLWSGGTLFARGSARALALAFVGVGLYGALAWAAEGPMSADEMFRQPERVRFASVEETHLAPHALVIGIALTDAGGRVHARAYPIQLIGYHHQVRDVVAGQAVMVTYCTVCRSGRVWRPMVDGRPTEFRLVGMDRWDAMFEDQRTGSWWRQATGEAIAGPAKGRRLEEIPSAQATWATWSARYPNGIVLEPDHRFNTEYAALTGYDDGSRPGKLTGRDPASWHEKSWVVGVVAGDAAHAFDWNRLVRERMLTDRVGDVPVLLTLDPDGATFHAFDARPNGTGEPVDLIATQDPGRLLDRVTGTAWSPDGLALDGPFAGARLTPLPAYQEFWHSWRTFHPQTTARRPEGE